MSLNVVIALAVFAVFGLAIASFISKIIKLGGISCVAFGAPIVRTVGEVSRTDSKGASVTLRVHVLAGGASGNSVGLEFITKGSSTYKTLAMSLPASAVKELVPLLEAAGSERVAAPVATYSK